MWAGEWVGREEMEQTLQTALSRNQVVKGKGSRRCQERSRMDGAFFFFFLLYFQFLLGQDFSLTGLFWWLRQ